MATRVPPHNLNAEESLLGAMLLSRDAVNTAAESGVGVEHFYKPAHQHVFDAMRSLLTIGEPIDPVTVADELRRVGLLDEIGGLDFLLQLQNSTPVIGNVGRYATTSMATAISTCTAAISPSRPSSAMGPSSPRAWWTGNRWSRAATPTG